MKIQWEEMAWNDYLYWQTQDKKTIKRINRLIQDIQRNHFDGIGKPEPLKDYDGFWSRRIDDKNRIIYTIKNESIIIAACKGHYNDR
ncbi:MAG: Txe/YoeB family addiction module toxin [Bacteroides sp.]|nr:Txe/YoeB family addiction module toxin [Eubacterium sp.]MCM1417292.1 Txe/YoeB family addiction module toxin [Roseburia sp.]MCM1461088.1 Txe/YoeB family addiction module toxin [Bacteroides sp.]